MKNIKKLVLGLAIAIIATIGFNVKAETIKEDIQVGSVTSITEKDVTFTYSPSSWTNGSVKVTATLKDMTSSYTLKITDSNPVGASKQTALSWANANTGITVNAKPLIQVAGTIILPFSILA